MVSVCLYQMLVLCIERLPIGISSIIIIGTGLKSITECSLFCLVVLRFFFLMKIMIPAMVSMMTRHTMARPVWTNKTDNSTCAIITAFDQNQMYCFQNCIQYYHVHIEHLYNNCSHLIFITNYSNNHLLPGISVAITMTVTLSPEPSDGGTSVIIRAITNDPTAVKLNE